ncbi:concanavalin A-like lectin/glucanase domain-containing protein [Gamsiella multidivaricata]|uniref:concanavalin A-like lectin/glucanase domain-containing protein n=1 Tax=Gamsiella multidivaricata TaxID=101098 RepID=UPI00221F879D|nr:concanavalin A-like lectin/glucanase domain-containing protein [Gamsiella multidivaricata]KAG0357772.1 hypothetical protein BGZ54_000207 [Gamsiella multidivaricata]KAI7826090.1 concanavalin A-like lectin/glucanase domain-containing protein [Gamsiella multidivaricata]
MKSLSVSLAILVLSLPFQNHVVQGSIFSRNRHHDLHDHLSNALTARESSFCGPHHMPCPAAEPCCNNGTCHTTSMEACPISLGCDSRHSHPDGCFSLPACRNLKENFKDVKALIPKYDFKGDPEQAHWVSDYHHIAHYAKIDKHQHKLLLRARRDVVQTQSGGGFGATVSSTRWNKYGTFTAKLKSGSTGPGIVTAFFLSNPALGEEISFELTGKDPKKVVTNYFRRVPAAASNAVGGHAHVIANAQSHPLAHSHLESHEETHGLKADTTKKEHTYKIEWSEGMIRWSVDGKVLRTVHAKDVESDGGIPKNPMQVQLTIWDAGYTPVTMDWAGGETSYGVDDMDEYVAAVSSVQIACHDPKEGNRPWPGPEASKRLKLAQAKAEADAKKFRKMNKGKYGHKKGMFANAKSFFEAAILSLLKWTFVLLAIICGAAYLTDPKTKSQMTSSSLSADKRSLATTNS